MVIDRLGSDLQKIWERSGGRMEKATVLQLGLRLVRPLPHLHSHHGAQRVCWPFGGGHWCLVWPVGERAGVHPRERVRARGHQSCQPSAGLQKPWTGQTGLCSPEDVIHSNIYTQSVWRGIKTIMNGCAAGLPGWLWAVIQILSWWGPQRI